MTPSCQAIVGKTKLGLLVSALSQEQKKVASGIPESLQHFEIVYAIVVFPVPAMPLIQKIHAFSPSTIVCEASGYDRVASDMPIHRQSLSRISSRVQSIHSV